VKKKFRAKAVLFDLWGTLAFSHRKKEMVHYIKRISGYKIGVLGGKFSRNWEKTIHTKPFPSREAELNSIFKGLKFRPAKAQFEKALFLYKKAREEIELFPESRRVLLELKKRGFALCLISNTSSSNSLAQEKLGISGFFDQTVLSFEIGAIKPGRKIFSAALHELGLKPKDCIMVGDKPRTDIKGAINSGITPILIDRKGRHKGLEGAKAKISSLAELPELLELKA